MIDQILSLNRIQLAIIIGIGVPVFALAYFGVKRLITKKPISHLLYKMVTVSFFSFAALQYPMIAQNYTSLPEHFLYCILESLRIFGMNSDYDAELLRSAINAYHATGTLGNRYQVSIPLEQIQW